jgi:hypothetical protein
VSNAPKGKVDAIDISEFEEVNSSRRVACWFSLLPFTDEQREKLRIACDERLDIKHKAIELVLEKWKFEVSDGSVARHRQRRCKCPKSEP